MIQGKVRINLSGEAILKYITEFDIFRYYIANNRWKLNEITNSPLHKDEHPSFIVGNRSGHLLFTDFALNAHGDCFTFVKLLHGCSYNEALKIIDRDFGLGIVSESNIGEYKKIISAYKQPEEDKERHSVIIQIVTRKFTKEELAYWNEYHQDLQDLRDNNIYSIEKMFLNRKRFVLKDTELRFGYLYEGRYWKLYRPYNSKKTKWLSNVPLSLAGGLNNLNRDYNTLVCKALKDQMVCRKIHPYVCHVQNESLAAFSLETVNHIKQNSNMVYYGGDSDGPGKNASYAITDTFQWKHINPPDYLLEGCCKDFADWGKRSIKEVENHFRIKGLVT